jgi:hypothetical protein
MLGRILSIPVRPRDGKPARSCPSRWCTSGSAVSLTSYAPRLEPNWVSSGRATCVQQAFERQTCGPGVAGEPRRSRRGVAPWGSRVPGGEQESL